MTDRRLPPPPRPGLGVGAARLADMLRVDHAGELGAVSIYRGQRAVFAAGHDQGGMVAEIDQMQAHEAAHLKAFDILLTSRRVRPTLLAPLWRMAGFALGVGTAILGEKAAYACTEAVETVIEQHYADQIHELQASDPELADQLTDFRDDELAHLAIAQGARAGDARGHGLLSAVIAGGCRLAIRVARF